MTRLSGVQCMRREALSTGYLALAPSILWPARPQLVEALEVAYDWLRTDAVKAAAHVHTSPWGDGTIESLAALPSPPRTRGAVADPVELLRAMDRENELRLARLAPSLDPAEAWARLVPAAFRDPADRWFLGATLPAGAAESPGVEVLRTTWGVKALSRAPTSLTAVVAGAGDPGGMAEAESLARELVVRLEPWCVRPVTRVVWHIEEEPAILRYRGEVSWRDLWTDVLGIAPAQLDEGDGEVSMMHVPEHRWRFEWQRLARQDVTRAEVWRQACASGLEVPWGGGLLGLTAAGPRFASLPDPQGLLLRIWELGYAIEAIAQGALILAASAPSGPALTGA